MSTPDKPIDTRWTQIVADPKWSLADLREIYEFRDMLYFMAWRDVKVRYKQTILGGMWVVLQPLITMLLFTVFFGKLARIPSDGAPYPLFYFAALVPWGYFSGAMVSASISLLNHTHMIKKLYFPRIVLPLAAIIGKFIDFLIALSVLFLMMLVFGQAPSPAAIIWIPLLVLILVTTLVGGSVFLSALIIKYRDFQFALTFGIQFLMFASPIIYPASVLPERFRLLYGLNPMAGVIEGFRATLLGTTTFPSAMVAVSATMSLVVLAIGLVYFKKVENYFADVA
ncbi:MAG: ABC transporter permease [Myxococcales bacterium]|nr:ABC transporter permease [Myxococcales bacterium]